MDMLDKCVILTGAVGGIGRQLAQRLDKAGARLTLVDLDEKALEEARSGLKNQEHLCIATDLTSASGRDEIVDRSVAWSGRVDTLINCAGINPFGSYTEQDPALIQKTLEVNMIAPMLLTHAVLPHMKRQKEGHIVNIGSIFGSIAFAWFAAYSASKYGLRGFSQALRRELDGSGIDVTYVAPRAVRTAINSQAVYEMAKAVNMKFDEPAQVAAKIMAAIESRKREVYIGFPESLFVRINAVAPGIVDGAVKKQNRIARQHALRGGAAA